MASIDRIDRKDKLEFILKKVAELGITAYEISRGTSLSIIGVTNIISGKSKRPHEGSVNEIYNFLFLQKSTEILENQSTISNLLFQNQQLLNVIDGLIMDKKVMNDVMSFLIDKQKSK